MVIFYKNVCFYIHNKVNYLNFEMKNGFDFTIHNVYSVYYYCGLSEQKISALDLNWRMGHVFFRD
jgi:hypothetical protein